MNKPIRIGTRDSELAMWQARTVEKLLTNLGHNVTLVPVKSTGDIILDKPLYELGITGVFTKTLDVALLKGEIDVAVHSMKDVPTALPQGITQSAVLQRGNTKDILVHKGLLPEKNVPYKIATSSLRRKAQWLHKFGNHEVDDLRGNVNSRLRKLAESNWNGAIFASAGLERINLLPQDYTELDWMIPAPAQGAIVVVSRTDDTELLDILYQINDIETEITTYIERQFLRTLEGGCTAPIGTIAQYNEHDDTIHFKGILLSLDGKQKFEIQKDVPIDEWKKLGFYAAKEILEKGGETLMKELKEQLKK